MFKNFEQPFWTEKLPAEIPSIKADVPPLARKKVKGEGPTVLHQMDRGVFDVVHTVDDYVVSDAPALAGLNS